jgi:membrane protein implicated in regulation of membrane protease activity
MTPLTTVRLIFLPLAVVALYLAARILIPGPVGIVIGLAAVAAGVLLTVLTVRRSRSQSQDK